MNHLWWHIYSVITPITTLHQFNGLFSRTTWVIRYQKGKISPDLNEARDSGVSGRSGIGWTICKQCAPSLQTDNNTNTSSLSFYRAMLCIRGTRHGPVSVCLSVTSRSSTKTVKRRITLTTPHDSPGTLVFWCQRSPRNSTAVTPYEGAECRWGGSKSATFDE